MERNRIWERIKQQCNLSTNCKEKLQFDSYNWQIMSTVIHKTMNTDQIMMTSFLLPVSTFQLNLERWNWEVMFAGIALLYNPSQKYSHILQYSSDDGGPHWCMIIYDHLHTRIPHFIQTSVLMYHTSNICSMFAVQAYLCVCMTDQLKVSDAGIIFTSLQKFGWNRVATCRLETT